MEYIIRFDSKFGREIHHHTEVDMDEVFVPAQREALARGEVIAWNVDGSTVVDLNAYFERTRD